MSLSTKIRTFKQLVEILETGYNDYSNLFKSLALLDSEIQQYVNWSDRRYTRNVVVSSPKLKILLLCWQPGQETPIHIHEGVGVFVKAIWGDLEVMLYGEDLITADIVQKGAFSLHEGDTVFFDQKMGMHSLGNLADDYVISLHIHIEGVASCEPLDWQTKKIDMVVPVAF